MIKNKDIDHGKEFDWGLTSKDYAKYRDVYPELFYQKIVDLGLCVKDQKVLDLGTGTGVLPRNMAKFGAKFIGADISENQISQAIELSKSAKLDIDFVVASAENFDFPEKTFDIVTACQCFMYWVKSTAVHPCLFGVSQVRNTKKPTCFNRSAWGNSSTTKVEGVMWGDSAVSVGACMPKAIRRN